MNSVWSESVYFPQFETLQESKKTDVLIIGGGMAGILCAYFLQEKGFEYLANLMTFSKKRCPHLGCTLKWNKEEHTWDCPCHGSRFAEDGTLLNNPANRDFLLPR